MKFEARHGTHTAQEAKKQQQHQHHHNQQKHHHQQHQQQAATLRISNRAVKLILIESSCRTRHTGAQNKLQARTQLTFLPLRALLLNTISVIVAAKS